MGLGGVGVKLIRSGHALCRPRAPGHRAAADRALRTRRQRRRRGGCWIRSPPGMWATSCSARRRRRMRSAGRIAFKTGTSLRLPRCLGGRLRRQAHHRRLGRPARWRAGARPGRPRGGGADPVRRIRPHRALPAAAAARTARASSSLRNGKLPPPLQRFRPGRWRRQRARRPCTSCSRPTAHGSISQRADGKPDPIPLKIDRRRRAAHGAGQRHAAAAAAARHFILHARRPRICPAHGYRRHRRHRQRLVAAAYRQRLGRAFAGPCRHDYFRQIPAKPGESGTINAVSARRAPTCSRAFPAAMFSLLSASKTANPKFHKSSVQ